MKRTKTSQYGRIITEYMVETPHFLRVKTCSHRHSNNFPQLLPKVLLLDKSILKQVIKFQNITLFKLSIFFAVFLNGIIRQMGKIIITVQIVFC